MIPKDQDDVIKKVRQYIYNKSLLEGLPEAAAEAELENSMPEIVHTFYVSRDAKRTPEQINHDINLALGAYPRESADYVDPNVQKTNYKGGKMIEITQSSPFYDANKFKEYVNKYIIRDFGGGGNCLFLSIAGALNNKYPNLKITHQDVREKIVSKLTDIHLWQRHSNPFYQQIYQQIFNNEENFTIPYDNTYKLPIYLNKMYKDGTWGTDIEIKTVPYVNFGDEQNPIYVNIYVIINADGKYQWDRNGEKVDAVIDQTGNGNTRFYQGFIQNESSSGIIIFNNTQQSPFITGTHYQAVIPQQGQPENLGKVPFIDWNKLDTASGGKKSKTKKSKSKKSRTKKSKK